jgi:glycerophosphoryl diester phosphodiesterase
MSSIEVVAHRGTGEDLPENTLSAFERAIELGADAVEFDVRLTSDYVPIVYHYYYLEYVTTLNGPVFKYTAKQIMDSVKFLGDGESSGEKIPTLYEVLESIGGKIGLEIEIKGPELEAPEIVSKALHQFKQFFDSIEITSYEPSLLLEFSCRCPRIATDLLIPRTENWMHLDVVAYNAIHRAKQAKARAVHLHPTQLYDEVVNNVREHGIQIHAWDVNSKEDLLPVLDFNITRMSTDNLDEFNNLLVQKKYEGTQQCEQND